MNKELDCRGLQCPEPVARCRAMLQEDETEKLTVLVDNSAALENVSRFLERNGYKIRQERKADNDWRIHAEKAAESQTDPACEVPQAKTLVLITTETLGRGDEELGSKLMATFLASLTELGESLWRIILLNGGVKLSATPGEQLESLKALAASGVTILVCGTCLMRYGLLDKKQVGETTNMMDVVTSLGLAQKVIRP